MPFKHIKKLELSENVNSFSKDTLRNISAEVDRINYYPDSNCSKLKELIAQSNNIGYQNVFIGNGSDEVILSILLGLGLINKKVVVPRNTFMGYYFACALLNNDIVEVDLLNYCIDIRKCSELVQNQRVRAIFICNPHNPFGTILEFDDVFQLVKLCEIQHVYLIIDEAYVEFLNNKMDFAPYTTECHYLIVIKTFSKAYGLAGIRCGYACASSTIIDNLNKVKKVLPYSVNRIALKAAEIVIKDKDHLKNTINTNNMVRLWFETQLDILGIRYVKSYTNFVSVGVHNVEQVVSYFRNESVLVKDLRIMGINEFIRITIGSKSDMEYVLRLISKNKQYFIST